MGGNHIKLGGVYGALWPGAGFPSPKPVGDRVFVSHAEQLRRDLEIINARTTTEQGPLLPDGLRAQIKRNLGATGRLLPTPINHEIDEGTSMKIKNLPLIATAAAGLTACQPSSIDSDAQPALAAAKTSSFVSFVESAASPRDLSTVREKIVFHCKTENDKEVSIRDLGDRLTYMFGKHGVAPEISLSVPRDAARTFQWKGMGRWISYSVSIPNGNTTYSVYTSLDRLTDEHEFEAGVMVEVDGNEIARIKCSEPIVHEIEGIDLKEE